jgi:putative endonuclease
MADHITTGNEGEKLAAEFLVKEGFTILHRNWRWGHLEVDLIACREGKLHFVEVKTRRSKIYGFPEEGVTRRKMKFLMKSADQYLHLNRQWKRIEFDILSILMQDGQEPEYLFIRDVHL